MKTFFATLLAAGFLVVNMAGCSCIDDSSRNDAVVISSRDVEFWRYFIDLGSRAKSNPDLAVFFSEFTPYGHSLYSLSRVTTSFRDDAGEVRAINERWSSIVIKCDAINDPIVIFPDDTDCARILITTSAGY